MRRDRDAECVERKETRGGLSPHHPTKGLGDRRKLPHRGPGRKWILCIFEVRKKQPGTPFFSIFERWRQGRRQGGGYWGPCPPPQSTNRKKIKRIYTENVQKNNAIFINFWPIFVIYSPKFSSGSHYTPCPENKSLGYFRHSFIK